MLEDGSDDADEFSAVEVVHFGESPAAFVHGGLCFTGPACYQPRATSVAARPHTKRYETGFEG
jgi:hypothetical protein